MDYISEMRKKIGHSPLIIPGAAVLLLNDHEELLMLLRKDNEYWGIPGGAMEPGEQLEETAAREVFEETGMRINDLSLFDVFSGAELYYEYPNGDLVYNVSVVFIANHPNEEITVNPNEHSEWKFFPLKNLPGNISPPIKLILTKFKTISTRLV